MIFGAAIVYAALWIAILLAKAQLPIPSFLLVPISGAISILIIEYIFKKTGFLVI